MPHCDDRVKPAGLCRKSIVGTVPVQSLDGVVYGPEGTPVVRCGRALAGNQSLDPHWKARGIQLRDHSSEQSRAASSGSQRQRIGH
jgi:hypothetical protein